MDCEICKRNGAQHGAWCQWCEKMRPVLEAMPEGLRSSVESLMHMTFHQALIESNGHTVALYEETVRATKAEADARVAAAVTESKIAITESKIAEAKERFDEVEDDMYRHWVATRGHVGSA